MTRRRRDKDLVDWAWEVGLAAIVLAILVGIAAALARELL